MIDHPIFDILGLSEDCQESPGWVISLPTLRWRIAGDYRQSGGRYYLHLDVLYTTVPSSYCPSCSHSSCSKSSTGLYPDLEAGTAYDFDYADHMRT